jgi:hypothetical protein
MERAIAAAYWVGTGLLLAHGSLTTWGTVQHHLGYNEALAELVPVVKEMKPGGNDLVIAPSSTGPVPNVDMPASWIPLAARTEVLYSFQATWDGLPRASKAETLGLRYALYLMLTGHDARWLEGLLAEPRARTDAQYFRSLGVHSPAADHFANAEARYASMEGDLLAPLRRIGGGAEEVRAFLRRYERVFLVDTVEEPTFVRAEVERYMRVVKENRRGEWMWYELEPR